MDLKSLRCICSVARHASISTAADHLMMSQPAVSKHVQSVEKELGHQVFDRTKRPIRPTSWGSEFIKLAESLLRAADSIGTDASNAELTQPISVAVTNMIVRRLVIPPLMRFRSLYPQTRISISGNTAYDMLRAVLGEQVDFGLGVVPTGAALYHLDYQHVTDLHWVLVVPLNHPLLESPPQSFSDIAMYPLILPLRGTYARSRIESECRKSAVHPEVVLEVGYAETIKECVAQNLGVSMLPRFSINPDDPAQIAAINIDDIFTHDTVGILKRPDHRLSEPAEVFISMVRSHALSIQIEHAEKPLGKVRSQASHS